MRGIRCAVAALLAAGIVAVVGAQPPRPGGGGGGFGDITTMALNNEALQAELKITDAQKEKFKPVAEKQAELNKKRGEAFGKGGKDFDKEKFAELRKEGEKLAEETKKVLDDTLTADQKKRIKQIGVQMMSVSVFTEPTEGKGGFGGTSEAQKATMKEVADALKLSDAQKAKIKGITDEYAKDRRAIRTDIFGEKGGFGKQDPEKTKDFNTKSAKLTEETMTKIADALDETQKKTWKELTGEAFDTSKLFTPRVQPKKD